MQTKLEVTIIDLAKQKLLELESHVKDPDANIVLAQISYSTTLVSLFQLIELANLNDSGMTDKGVKELLKIEQAVNSICSSYEPSQLTV